MLFFKKIEYLPKIEEMVSMDNSSIDLETIGWDSYFEDNFIEFNEEGFIPGLITEVQRKSFMVIRELGEIESRVSGKFREVYD